MKKIFNYIKRHKLLTLMFIISIFSFIFGTLFISILNNDSKKIIVESVNNFFTVIMQGKINYKDTLIKSISNNLIINLLVWLLGISIIGIPIVLVILALKCFICSFTFTSILYVYGFKGLPLGIVYIFPHVLNFLILFILIYYSLAFSKTLFNYLFRKKECNRSILMHRYVKLLGVSSILFVLTTLVETYFVPFFIKLF